MRCNTARVYKQKLFVKKEICPPWTLLNRVQRTKDISKDMSEIDYISIRVTTCDRNLVFDLFKGCCCVIAEEHSKEGVQHYHVVVKGHEMYETLGKRLQRAKLGVNKYWRKKNHGGDFLKAIAYTVKCGEYWTRSKFYEYLEQAPEWVPTTDYVRLGTDGKDTSKHWQLTYSNLLKVAFNYRRKNELKTERLSDVLAHLAREDLWIPTPQMIKQGLDKWYHDQFTWMCSSQMAPPPQWWEPRTEGLDYKGHPFQG